MPYAIRVVKAHEVWYAICRFSMGKAMKRAAIYLRVSTQDQTTSNQEHELRQAAERADWQVAKVYRDHGISGAKGRMEDRRSMHCAGTPLSANSTS